MRARKRESIFVPRALLPLLGYVTTFSLSSDALQRKPSPIAGLQHVKLEMSRGNEHPLRRLCRYTGL